ncbi:hypothetical protein [Methanomethylovorans sp.]
MRSHCGKSGPSAFFKPVPDPIYAPAVVVPVSAPNIVASASARKGFSIS